MDNSFSKKQLGLAVTCALALSFASGAAQAQTRGVPIDDRQVWVDQGKTQVWMNGFRECWHSAYGPPPGYGPCNPAPLAQYLPPPPPSPLALRHRGQEGRQGICLRSARTTPGRGSRTAGRGDR